MDETTQTNENSAVPRPDHVAAGEGVTASEQGVFVPLAEEKTATKTYKDEGWSWGGFSFNFFFAIATRDYVYLFLLIGLLIPGLNAIVMIASMVFFGIKGREIAQKSRTFANKDEYLGFMKGVDHAGKIVAFIYIGLILVSLFLIALLFSVFMGHW